MSKKIAVDNCRVEVICVGSELLLDRVNTDVNLLSGILGRAGFTVSRCCIVGDDIHEISEAVSSAMKRSDFIFVTGGLGPTSDDITRESVSELLKRKLVFDEEIWKGICKRLRSRGIKVFPGINKKQAYVMEGSSVVRNEIGTAPGIAVQEGTKEIVLLPGPPAELAPMAEKYVNGMKRRRKGKGLKVYRLGISGASESIVEEYLYPFMKERGIAYTILAQPHMIEIVIVSPGMPAGFFPELKKHIKNRFGDSFLGVNPTALPEIVGDLLRERGWKIALAESCTGGLGGKILTDIPGSSDFFQGSFVVYSNVLKKRILKVPRTILKKYGAVSEQTALHMAKGARKAGKCEVALSFTGIAGPSGASPDKPVGLVYIGAGLPGNRFYAHRFVFSGNRQRIRERTVYQGFDLLRKYILKTKTG